MKSLLITLSLLLQLALSDIMVAQPIKVWSKFYGGNNSDVCSFLAPYNDTMLIAVGRSQSTDVGGNKGLDDYLICQFKPNGNLIRYKTFGSATSDQANSYTILPNGNLLIGGYTSGKGGDVSNWYGLIDAWVVGYDPNTGMKLWEKNYGGTNGELINDIFYLEPNRIVFAGYTKSIDKDLVSAPTKGGNDIFISSIDESGGLIKATTFGGTKDDVAKKIVKADVFGGQMLIFGESESNDLDFNGLNHGKKDIFILKINRSISKVFLTTIGGTGDDLFADAINLGENGIIVFGTVNTAGGQVDSLKGLKDIWMTKLDKNGVFQWSKNIGGKNDDSAIKAQLTANNEIILLANSSSKDQDILANYGGVDIVVMKLDTSGNIIWQKNYGGTNGENGSALCALNDGSIYFVAQSFSTNNDLPSTNTSPPAPDFWTVKLFECTTVTSNHSQQACTGDTVFINGFKFYSGKDSLTIRLKTVNGCDSLVHIAVTFTNATKETITDSLCNEGTITINNVIFDKTHPKDSFKLKNFLGCDSVLTVDLFFATPILVVDTIITKDNGNGTGCIHITVDGGCKPYTYEWSNGKSITNEDCDIAAGKYKVVVTDCRNCSKEFEFVVPTLVATQSENQDAPSIRYNDNQIEIVSKAMDVISFSLYNASGQLELTQKPADNRITILRKSIPTGIYIGEFTSKNGKHVQFKITN